MYIDLFQEFRIFFFDVFKYFPVISHQVHFVHKYGYLPDSQHGQEISVSSCIFLYPVGGVDHQQRRFRTGSACYHIFQKFNMSWSVYNNIISFFRLEKTSCCVNGDSLGLLVFQSVQQKRVFKRFGIPFAVFLDRFQFSFRKSSRVCKKSPYNSTFSVVHMAHCNNIQ